MIRRFYLFYIDSFRGFRKEVWWLALVTFINRAGTMVFPFLSLYLKEELGFDYAQIGWIMSAFGAGSVAGALLGGRLSDKFGFYPVIFGSLFLSGLLFIGLQYIQSFTGLVIYTFLSLTVADTLRPAVYVAINTYSRPDNRTRSVTLIRLAINLGFALGPAAGGFIIALISYKGLFWVDGLTCLLAAFVFILLLDRRRAVKDSEKMRALGGIKPYRDGPYLLFLGIVFLIGFGFLQLFSTVPLFYKEIHELRESSIGLLMAFNGLFIFLFEMPLIKYLEQSGRQISLLIWSTLLLGLSFLVLNLFSWTGILILSMFFLTIGEMVNFPFLNRFALDRGQGAHTGQYMALFTMSFSMGHIFGPNVGMQLTERFGFQITWYFIFLLFLLAMALLLVLRNLIRSEKQET